MAIDTSTNAHASVRSASQVRITGVRLKRAWVPLVLVAASLIVPGAVTVLHSDALSPIDEWVYVDYLYKLPTEGILLQGEEIGKEALEIMACNGVTPYGPMGPACGSDYSVVSEFPFGGITSADAYTPIYFAITRVVGDTIHILTGTDQLTAWRLTGPLWLALSMVVFYLLLRKWAVHPLAVLAIGLAFIASPFSWWTYTYVSTDAPSFLVGALLILLATRYVRGEGSGWWIPALSVLAVLTKVTNILGVCLVALILAFHWIAEFRSTSWSGPRTRRPNIPNRYSLALPGIAAASVMLASVAQLAWLALRRAMAIGMPADQSIGIALDTQELVSQMTNFLPGTIVANVNIAGSTGYALPVPGFVVAPLSWICIAGVIGAFWALGERSRHAPLVIAVALSAALFAPMLAIVIQVTTGGYYTLPPRYGAPILAGFLLLAGMTMTNRWATWILLTYAVALSGAMLFMARLLSGT